MNKLNRILAFAGILLLLATASAWGQAGGAEPGMGGPGPGGGPVQGLGKGPGMQYDPKSVETVSGEVTQVQQSQLGAKGINLEVKTDKETLLVILGPAFYLEEQKMRFTVGDKVEVKGTRIQHPRKMLLIAGEAKKGDQVLKLRDGQGVPLWPRGPMRKTPTN